MYFSWTKLFQLLTKAYKVLDHIDDVESPTLDSDEDAEWSELDSLVLQEIYNTISEKILARILKPTPPLARLGFASKVFT